MNTEEDPESSVICNPTLAAIAQGTANIHTYTELAARIDPDMQELYFAQTCLRACGDDPRLAIHLAFSLGMSYGK